MFTKGTLEVKPFHPVMVGGILGTIVVKRIIGACKFASRVFQVPSSCIAELTQMHAPASLLYFFLQNERSHSSIEATNS